MQAANTHFTCWPLRTVAVFDFCGKQMRAHAHPEAIPVNGCNGVISFCDVIII